MYSAYLAKKHFSESEFILMNGDVFFEPSILEELLNTRYDNAIVVEKGIYLEESMKVKVDNSRITAISKQISPKDAYGVSIDIYRFSKMGSRLFFKKMSEYIEEKKDFSKWTEVALNDILFDITFNPCPVCKRWIEIDDINDLTMAQHLFKKNIKLELNNNERDYSGQATGEKS